MAATAAVVAGAVVAVVGFGATVVATVVTTTGATVVAGVAGLDEPHAATPTVTVTANAKLRRKLDGFMTRSPSWTLDASPDGRFR